MRLTNNMQVAQPGLGPGSVDLAHVLALVRPLHVPDVEVPHAVTVVAHPDPGVPRDNVVLDREDGRPVVVDPGHLVRAQPHHGAGQHHVSTLRNRHVLHSSDEIWSQTSRLYLVTCNYKDFIEDYPLSSPSQFNENLQIQPCL